MTPQQTEAMKLAFEALKSQIVWFSRDTMIGKSMREKTEKAITAIEKAMAQPEQEPVKCNLCDDSGIGSFGVHSMCICQYAKATPQQRTEQKMVMWPCLIDTADFSKGTVTIVMQCEDYKVSAGTHWLSTTPLQRTWEVDRNE